MPGVVNGESNGHDAESTNLPTTMASNAANGMTGEHAEKTSTSDLTNGDSHINGVVPTSNGVHANGIVKDSTTSSEHVETVVQKIMSELPPEITHITQGYISLSTLLTRLCQDTFNSTEDLINELAEMQPSQANGSGPSPAIDLSNRKKTRILEWGQDRRQKFIKVLVISQWARHAEAVSRAVDVNVWINLQKKLYQEAVSWVGELKRIIAPLKRPPPDMETAFKVLSTGKADWISDLGYIRPEPLTPQEMLKVLRTLNVLLTIRLITQEKIPPWFEKYTISSGRVTFKVRDEFELDLSLADEDPASQLYFIDFRFKFAPCPEEVPEGIIRNEIEGRTNDLLRREGLEACYDFLHNLVLTHKLQILRQQAYDMANGFWCEDIRIEPVHRSVVVQYWVDRPGDKNWIEIGMKSGKAKEKPSSLKAAGTPFIALRWHRHGKEVLDHGIDMDLADLSMETIVKRVVATHINYIFKETKRRLRGGLLYSNKILFAKHRASTTEPALCALNVQFSKSQKVSIVQEPISGRFSIIPLAPLNLVGEQELNMLQDPANEAAAKIASLRCRSVLAQVESGIGMNGWHSVANINPNPETVKNVFSAEVMKLGSFRPASWGKDWMLAATTSMAGDLWWVVEMRVPDKNSTPMEMAITCAQPLKSAFKVPVAGEDSMVFDPLNLSLSTVESAAAAIISQFIDCRELANVSMLHSQRNPIEPHPRIGVPDIFIQYPPKQVPIALRPRVIPRPWCHELVKMSFLGLSITKDSVINLISGRLIVPIPNVQALTSHIDSSLAFHPHDGTFAFRLCTPIGHCSVPDIRERFIRIERLVRFLEIAKRNKLQCEKASLSNITFIYAPELASGPLKVEISFCSDSPIRISFEAGNPHLRIQDFLTTLLNTDSGFEHVALLLTATLPLLRAFTTIESMPRKGTSSVQFLPRSVVCHCVRYEGPVLNYEIRLRQLKDEVVWFSLHTADEEGSGNSEQRSVATTIWKQLCAERGEGWKGMIGGIMAQVSGVEALIMRIDKVIQELADNGSGTRDTVEANNDATKAQEIVILD